MYLIYCKMLLFHGKVTFFFFLLYEVASFQFWKPPFCSWWCWWWVVCVWELRKQLRWKQQKSIVQYYNWDIVSRRFNLKTFFTSFLFFFFFVWFFFFKQGFLYFFFMETFGNINCLLPLVSLIGSLMVSGMSLLKPELALVGQLLREVTPAVPPTIKLLSYKPIKLFLYFLQIC